MSKIRKYYNWMAIPAIIIITISLFSGFSKAEIVEGPENLLEQRSQLMQDFLDGEISYNDISKELSKIETAMLLNDDLKNLNQMTDTDFDEVSGMYITSCKCIRKLYDIRSYEVDIKWEMNGYEGNYTSQGKYYVVMEKVGNKYLLSKFNYIS